MYLIQTITTM